MTDRATIAEAVAAHWLALTIDSYPAAVRSSLISGTDPFRNPVGYTLKENLSTLANEVLGAMDKRAIDPAIDALVRLRAVQDFSPSDALRFISELRKAITEVDGSMLPGLEKRIDGLARQAAEKYTT